MPGPLYPMQPVFARGELSPRLFSRADIDHYKMGLAECVNWLILKQGGLRRRSGTEWINYGKFPQNRARLHKFVFSTLQAYTLEFGDHYIRFYANGGIVSKNARDGITFTLGGGGVVSVNWPGHNLAPNDPVMFSTTGALPSPLVPGLTYYVRQINPTQFSISATHGGPEVLYTAAGSGTHAAVVPVEVITQYDKDDVWKLQFAQSADVLYIAHPDFQQQMLSRFSGSTFTLIPYVGYDGPYLPSNTTGTTMTPSGVSGNVKITASSVVGINGNTGFVISDIGRPITLQYSSKWYWARITSVGVATSVITFSASTDKVTWANHGHNRGEPVFFTTGGGVIASPLADGVTYYLRDVTPGDFKLSATPMTRSVTNEGDVTIQTVGAPFAGNQFSWASHKLHDDDPVVFTVIPTGISGLTLGTTYYARVIDEDRFQVYDRAGVDGVAINVVGPPGLVSTLHAVVNEVFTDGPAINLTTDGTGTTTANLTGGTFVFADVYGLIAADGSAVGAFPGTGATGGWALGAWSEMTGWPGCVTFYQQRLVWARTDTQPQTVWLSKAGVLDNFSTTEPMQDDDALTLTILAGEVNAIAWVAEGQDMMIGTSGAMRTIGPADAGKNFGPTNFTQKRQSTFGSLDLQPVQIGEVAIYASFYGLSLREFLWSFQINGYTSPELTILSEHMLRSGVKQFTYAQDRDSIIWNAMGNGELVGVTYDRDQQIVACTRHRIGGEVLNSGIVDPLDPDNPDTPYGIVESVTTIPGEDRSEVWVSVRRTINGTDVRHIERMTVTFEAMPKEDAVFVDASFTYRGTPAGSIAGVNWLANQTVSILADGAVLPDVAVDANGSFTLCGDKEAETLTFGLAYVSRAKTLRIAQGQPDGTGIGRRKNIITANIDVMETGYLEIGSPSARELQVKVGLRGVDDAMDTSPPLHDGVFAYRFDRSWRDGGQIVMQTDKPLPATIRSVTPVFDAEP